MSQTLQTRTPLKPWSGAAARVSSEDVKFLEGQEDHSASIEDTQVQNAKNVDPQRDREIFYTSLTSHSDTAPRVIKSTFAKLAALYEKPTIITDTAPCVGKKCKHKNGPAVSPGRCNGAREDVNVTGRDTLLLDLDHYSSEELGKAITALDGYEFFIATTHSHKPPSDQAWRAGVHLSREVTPQEWPVFWTKAVDFFASRGVEKLDRVCHNLERLYYLPKIHQCDEENYEFEHCNGKALDVDTVLASTHNGKPAATPPLRFVSSTSQHALRSEIQRLYNSKAHSADEKSKEHAEILRRVLAGEALASEGNRDLTLFRAIGVVVCNLELEVIDPSELLNVLGRSVLATVAATPGEDANEWLELTAKKIKRALKGQIEKEEQLEKDRELWALLLARRNAAKGITDRARIEITTDIHLVTDDAINALAKHDKIYQRGRSLVVVSQDDAKTKGSITRQAGSPVITVANNAVINYHLSESATFFSRSKGKNRGEHDQAPPKWIAEQIRSMPSWPNVRRLAGVIETPVFLSDGSILDEPGYHEASELSYAPNTSYPKVSDNPTRDEIEGAKSVVQEAFSDFPFEKAEHKSAALAALFTLLCRWSFNGNFPVFLIDASAPGSGKTLLADVIAMLAIGRKIPRLGYTEDNTEMEKRLFSLAVAGDPALLFDNINSGSTLGGSALDLAVTSRGSGLTTRAMGSLTSPVAPWDVVVFVTGNNVQLGSDTPRRTLQIKLLANEENPEERTVFKHSNLILWCEHNRARVVSAALTLARAWHVAGRPAHSGKAWGSFAAWSDVVRSIVVHHGFVDPGEARGSQAEGKFNPARELKAALIDAVSAFGKPVYAKDITAALVEDKNALPKKHPRLWEALGLMNVPLDVLPTAHRLSKVLSANSGSVIDGKRLISTPDRNKIALWSVVQIDRSAGVAGVRGCS